MGLFTRRKRALGIRPTPRILVCFAIDMCGLFLFGAGAMYLSRGESLITRNFPSTKLEAAASSLVGLFVMFWGAARMLREMQKQMPLDGASENTDTASPGESSGARSSDTRAQR
jgi:hypothetical protein